MGAEEFGFVFAEGKGDTVLATVGDSDGELVLVVGDLAERVAVDGGGEVVGRHVALGLIGVRGGGFFRVGHDEITDASV